MKCLFCGLETGIDLTGSGTLFCAQVICACGFRGHRNWRSTSNEAHLAAFQEYDAIYHLRSPLPCLTNRIEPW